VGVAGARAGQRTVAGDLALVAGARVDQQVLARHRIGAHHLLPLRPLGVRDLDRERRAEGEPMAETAVDRQHVLLELLTAAAAVAEPAPGERRLQIVTGQLDAGGDAVEQGDEGGAVGFPGREPAQHGRHSRMRRGRVAPASTALPLRSARASPALGAQSSSSSTDSIGVSSSTRGTTSAIPSSTAVGRYGYSAISSRRVEPVSTSTERIPASSPDFTSVSMRSPIMTEVSEWAPIRFSAVRIISGLGLPM